MKFVCYPVYQLQSISERRSLETVAKANSNFSFGIDIAFYPPCFYETGRSWTKQAKFVIDYLISYCKWFISNTIQGHLIFPAGLICTVIDLFFPFYKQRLIDCESFRQFYLSASSRSSPYGRDFVNELMATYIRYIADPSELYGLKPYDSNIINKIIFRISVYSFILRALFALKPFCYFSYQRSYIQKYLPCQVAIDSGIPVVVLGCPDKSRFKISDQSVPKHWDTIDMQSIRARNLINIQDILDVENDLKNRIKESKIDSSIWYMKTSPYKESQYKPDAYGLAQNDFIFHDLSSVNKRGMDIKKPFVGVYMHEFADYQHNGTLSSFSTSYFEWLLTILQILIDNQIPYVLKLHPAILDNPKSDKYSSSLKALNHLPHLLNSRIHCSLNSTTLDLIANGMSLGCTMKGTIATELIFLKIPCICSGVPPYQQALPNRVLNDLYAVKSALLSYKEPPPVTETEYNNVLEYLAIRSMFNARNPVSEESLSLVEKYNLNLSLVYD